jgi:uracil-DNA glycosylase
VVITGQDPYHGPNQAHGLCFSIRPPTPAPPSLQNIYKALKIDYPDYKPPPNKSGLLTPWADRGVLLLNTCLTVRKGDANSHAGKGWELLTQKVIDTVSKVRTRGVVFLAWGTPAQNRTKGIPADKHLILKSVHPSPLSASRGFVSHSVLLLTMTIALTICSSIAITSPSATSGLNNVMARMVVLIGISI